MTMEVRRIALASPGHSRPPRFAVGGQITTAASGDVKMFEWSRERGEMSMVGLQTDAGQIRAMAWSPSTSHPYLLAVGLSSGKTNLLSLSPHTLSLSVSSSHYTPPISLNIKHSRAVTSLDFCPTDSSYLAAGLERHRSDNSLLIWDVHDAISSLPSDKPSYRPADRIEVVNPLALNSRPGDTRPIQQYCQGEHINSVAFLRGGGYLLVASSNNKQIRLWDLRSSNNAPSTNSPREAIGPNAGGGGSGGGAHNWPTRAVYGLTPSHERGERFASWEPTQNGSIVRIWDTRRASEVLSFDVGPNVVGMQWMDGGLGVGTKEGGVGVWDVINGQLITEGGADEWVTLGGMRQIVKPKQNLHSFAYAPSEGMGDVLFVLKDGTIGIGPIPSCPAIANAPTGDLAIGSHSIHLISQDSEAPRTTLPSDETEGRIARNPFQLSPERIRQILADADTARFSRINSHDLSPSPRASRRVTQHRDDEPEETDEESGFKSALSLDIGATMRARAEEGYGLRSLLLNAAIASRHQGSASLMGVWELVDHFTRLLDGTAMYKSESLAGAGILSIWSSLGFGPTSTTSSTAYTSSPTSFKTSSTLMNEPTQKDGQPIRQGSAAWASLKSQTLQASPNISGSSSLAGGSSAARRGSHSSQHPGTPANASTGPQLPTPEGDWNAAMGAVYDNWVEGGKVVQPRGKLPNSDRMGARRVILALCGDGLADGEGGGAGEGTSRRAAWAYFANDEEMAIRVLLQSSNAKHRLTGAALAATISRPARKPAADFGRTSEGIDDPYLRAMLRRVAGDPWASIMAEDIPLTDRIVMAVHNLADRELNDFFNGLYGSLLSTSTPSLEVLALTGVGGMGIPLLREYLETTGDIQTVALLSAFISPERSSGGKVKPWTEAYRDLLDAWKLWSVRSEFDVLRGEIQLNLSGGGWEKEGSKGGYCPVCNHALTKPAEDLAHRKNALRGTMSWPNERTTTCVYCGNALPRCVICLQLVEARWSGGAEEEGGWDYRVPPDTIDTAYVCCQSCRHGGHAYHILPWFTGGLDGEMGHDTCAVKGCECECGSL